MEVKLTKWINRLIITLTLLAIPIVVFGQPSTNVMDNWHTQYYNTVDMNSTNTSQVFTTALITAYTARHSVTLTAAQLAKVKAVWLTVENQDIRIAFGVDPTQATSTTAVGHVLAAGATIRIVDPKKISTMRFISKTNNSHAHIQASLEY